MTHARSKGWTTGDEVTLRGDRFCLPLRSGDSRRIEGIDVIALLGQVAKQSSRF